LVWEKTIKARFHNGYSALWNGWMIHFLN